MNSLFIDTGVQEFDVSLEDDEVARATGVDPEDLAAELGGSWIRADECRFARVKIERRGTTFHFRIAVDTTAGDFARGFAAVDDLHHGSYPFTISIPTPAATGGRSLHVCDIILLGTHHLGQPIPVTLILDIGNSRTCSLAIEDTGGADPFTLDSIRPIHLGGSSLQPIAVFPSVMEFVPPAWKQDGSVIEYSVRAYNTISDRLTALFRYRPYLRANFNLWPEEVFGSNAITAIGLDAERVRSAASHSSPSQTGLSSPKRYLWDDEQLGHAWCFLATSPTKELEKIRGQLLQFLTLDDSDSVLANYPVMGHVARMDPSEPNYPRRALMVFFLYALLRECFRLINSPGHRLHSSHPQRSRRIQHLVLTYPSAMSRTEVARFEKQAKKALGAFAHLCQPHAPEISLSIDLDEGVASHVAFLSAELLSRERIIGTGGSPLRVGAVDIGGGTLDLAIASYELTETVGERRCRVEFVDGAYIGGDDVVREVIAEVIVPRFDTQAEDILLSDFFQGTVGGELLALRMRFIRACLQPLAFECLQRLKAGEQNWSLPVADYCNPVEVLTELDRFLITGGERGWLLNWVVHVEAQEISDVLERVVGPSLARFGDLLTQREVDYVLLAGKLSSLPKVRQLLGGEVRPFTLIEVAEQTSLLRVYQEIFGPVEVDPKTSVAIGAALDWCAKVGRSPTAEKVVVDYTDVAAEFVWGFINPATCEFSKGPRGRRLLVWKEGVADVSFSGTQFIGRQLRDAGVGSVVVPRYRLSAGGTARAILRKYYDNELAEEVLELVDDPEYTFGDVQLRPQSKIDGVYWLDSGKLSGGEV